MGLFNFFGSLKQKAQDVTLDKVLERMRDMKVPVSQRAVGKLLATHVLPLPGVKSASVDISRDGLTVKLAYTDQRPAVKQHLRFAELLWTPHKRAFVFVPEPPFDYLKEHGVYACVATCLAGVLRQMLSMSEEKLKEANFSCDIGPSVTGVMEKDGKLYYEPRRMPLLRQYMYFRVMGQAVMDHLNVTDCWCENGRVMVRIDNNRVVDQIRNMNLDPSQLRRMLKGDMAALQGGKE